MSAGLILLLLVIGGPVLLSEADIAETAVKFETYGLHEPTRAA